MIAVLGIILMVIGVITPILSHNAYVDEYFRFNKYKAGLIFTGSSMLMVMGCYLLIHSEI